MNIYELILEVAQYYANGRGRKNTEVCNQFTLPTIYRYHRGMKWNSINKKYSKDCVAHHINNNYVVYISKELHEKKY